MKITRLFLGICCAAAALAACSKAEKVTKEAPTRPMTIVPVEGDDFLYLILPVMLRSYE